MFSWLQEYSHKQTCRVVGLMSGTSLDGVDVAYVHISGSGETLQANLVHFLTVPFEEDVRREILRLHRNASASDVAVWNFKLGEIFAAAILELVQTCGLSLDEIDLIGSHGQTVSHLPQQGATLQIGEPGVIAERTGVTTVADFRPRDMAAGGQGAPLVPYVDYLLLRHPSKNRIVQNIGGIANLTYLPAGGTLDEVLAFDTGPGNMVIDDCVRVLTEGARHFDYNGYMAAQGEVDETWLAQWMRHAFFGRKPPKSCGREEFGTDFTAAFIQQGRKRGLSANDLVATATALTAASIAAAYRDFLPEFDEDSAQVILGGGGAFNSMLKRMLQERLARTEVVTQEKIGLRSDAKEALAFAVLAHETVMGVANNVTAATGASRRVVLGKIVPA